MSNMVCPNNNDQPRKVDQATTTFAEGVNLSRQAPLIQNGFVSSAAESAARNIAAAAAAAAAAAKRWCKMRLCRIGLEWV